MSEKNAPRTVIGADTVVSGEVHATQDLVVHGRVDGAIRADAVLFIEADGVVEATVTANHAVIAGTFQGDLDCMEALEVTESGRIHGNVRAPRMLIADGAILNAEISMTSGGGSSKEAAEVAAPRVTTTSTRSVYTYSVPTPEAVLETEIEGAATVVEVVKAPARKVTKGGKKKNS